MRVQPDDVTDADVAECVAAGWGVRVDEIAYAPVGFGSHHWWVTTGSRRLFATVDVARAQGALEAALGTAAALRDGGLEFVHAPVARADGSLLRTVSGHYPLCLHSWLDGTVVADLGDDHAAQLIGLLARLHAVTPVRTPARRADLTVQGRTGFEQAMCVLDTRWPGPYGERTRELIREHRAELSELFAIHDEEVAKMLADQSDWVITRGEPHTSNVVEDATGLHLIDWDTTLVAPASRDVWQVGGAPEADIYRQLTGRALPQAQLDHFRRDWDLAEICLYTADFAARHEDTADTAIMWEGLNESLDRLLR